MPENKSLAGLACYACNQPAVSWEHAPPKGFYPRRSDVHDMPKGRDFRQNLITVPSCEAHNTAKSKDDNFAQAVIAVVAAAYGGHLDRPNTHPFVRHAIEKVRKGIRLRKAMIEDATPVLTQGGIVFALKPEAPTLRRTFELVAHALYYHEHKYRERWPGTCVIQSPYFLLDDLTHPPGTEAMRNMLTAFDANWGKNIRDPNGDGGDLDFRVKGPHPEVFAYQLLETDDGAMMRMRLYGGFDFLATTPIPPAS